MAKHVEKPVTILPSLDRRRVTRVFQKSTTVKKFLPVIYTILTNRIYFLKDIQHLRHLLYHFFAIFSLRCSLVPNYCNIITYRSPTSIISFKIFTSFLYCSRFSAFVYTLHTFIITNESLLTVWWMSKTWVQSWVKLDKSGSFTQYQPSRNCVQFKNTKYLLHFCSKIYIFIPPKAFTYCLILSFAFCQNYLNFHVIWT